VANLTLMLACPLSAASWPARPRGRPGRVDRQAVICPSCGRRLELHRVAGVLELTPASAAGGEGAHRVLH